MCSTVRGVRHSAGPGVSSTSDSMLPCGSHKVSDERMRLPCEMCSIQYDCRFLFRRTFLPLSVEWVQVGVCEEIIRPRLRGLSSPAYVRSPHGRGIAHASRIRVLKRVCGGRRCVSGRKSSVGPCLMPTCPLDVASMFGVHANNEKDSDQTLVLPLQAPERALFAPGAAMAVAAWNWRVVGKHTSSHRVQVEAGDLL
jgi:hypothetical protein